jgi:multidrug resistance efflux pump
VNVDHPFLVRHADTVDVAPDVSGFVTDVMVRDNQQVRRGDIIFQIDRARFALALQQADAVVAGRRASLDQAESDLKRYRQLTTLAVSQQKQEQVLATEQQAKAAYIGLLPTGPWPSSISIAAWCMPQ